MADNLIFVLKICNEIKQMFKFCSGPLYIVLESLSNETIYIYIYLFIYLFIYSYNFVIIFTNRYSEFRANAIFKRLNYYCSNGFV